MITGQPTITLNQSELLDAVNDWLKEQCLQNRIPVKRVRSIQFCKRDYSQITFTEISDPQPDNVVDGNTGQPLQSSPANKTEES